MVTPVLECKNVSISYYTRAGEVPAVYDFNLTVNPGRGGRHRRRIRLRQVRPWRSPSCNTWARTGAVTAGEIKFLGRDMRTMNEEELRQIRGSQIAMVYQEPMASLNPSMLDPRSAHRSADGHE